VPAKYTIKEVEERTGVAAATLRQWERRYRLPRPQRSSGGYRLYSDEDLDSIREMQDFIAKGVPPSRAAELVQQAAESVRRTAGEHRGGRSVAELADELALALRSLDMARAERVLSEGHAVHPLEDVLLAVIAPAMFIGLAFAPQALFSLVAASGERRRSVLPSTAVPAK